MIKSNFQTMQSIIVVVNIDFLAFDNDFCLFFNKFLLLITSEAQKT